MNELIKTMSDDMKILPYSNEPKELFEYRVIYSALGYWCLTSALNEKDHITEISKTAQTALLHKLLEKYTYLFPHIKEYLTGMRNSDIAVHIRNLYEQMGYFLTNDDNRNMLNYGGETVKVSEKDSIFLGIPDNYFQIDGLGIHIENFASEIPLKEYLIRDSLSPEEFILSRYNSCDFEEKEIDPSEFEFFDPLSKGKFSESWRKYCNTDMTVARESLTGPYYRVMIDESKKLVFASENYNDNIMQKTGAEFRRLYIALKKYYLNPMKVLVCPIDQVYSYIRILGQLPNREYFYLLLNAWPQNAFYDRHNFIIRNELKESVVKLLKEIGFKEKKGVFYEKNKWRTTILPNHTY